MSDALGEITSRLGAPVSSGRAWLFETGFFLAPGLTFRSRFLTPTARTAVFARPEFTTTGAAVSFSWDFYEGPTFTDGGVPATMLAIDRDGLGTQRTLTFFQPNASAFGLELDGFAALIMDMRPQRPFFYWRLAPSTEYLSLITNVSPALIVPLPRWRFIEVDLPVGIAA